MSGFDWAAAEAAVQQWEARKLGSDADSATLPAAPSPAPSPSPAPPSASGSSGSIAIAALTPQEAVSLAKTWYDEQGPFVGTFVMATPVSAAHFNYIGPRDCECSIRYSVRPDTGESYFVRFIYKLLPGTDAWCAVGMDMGRASELPDSDSEGLSRSWRALVERCARALGRSESNLPAYTSPSSISRQLAALGTDNAQQVLQLAEQRTDESDISDDDSKWLLSTIAVALKDSAVMNDNGARAGLAAIKWVAGRGVKYANTGGPRKKSVEESTSALRKRESPAIKSEPGTVRSNGGAWYVNDITEPSAPPGTAVPTPGVDCMVCANGWSRPCTCGRKRPRDSAPEQTHSVATTGETDRSQNEHGRSGALGGNKAERSLLDDSRLDTEWQQEEQQRRRKEARKRQTETELKRRREAEYAGSGITTGRWRVVFQSTWWGRQSYAV